MSSGLETLLDRDEIARFLQRDPALHLYELGDLDDFFWPHTRWFGQRAGAELEEVVLLYGGMSLSTLLGFSSDPARLAAVVAELAPALPRRFYAHLSGDAVEALADAYALEPHGTHLKLVLRDATRLPEVPSAEVAALRPEHAAEALDFYSRAYPHNWFDPRMLETGRYLAVRHGGALVAVAGVHVWSPRERVAALGNVATLPAARGRGLGRTVTAALCRLLLGEVDLVGLNVSADNAAALALYEGLGFVRVAAYRETMATAK